MSNKDKIDLLEEQIMKVILTHMQKGIIEITSETYNNPLYEIYKKCLENHSSEINNLFENIISTALSQKEFKEELKKQVIKKISQTVVSQADSVITRSVQKLKANESFKARMLLLVESCIKEENAN